MISHSPTVQAASEEKCSWSSEQANCDLLEFLRKRLLKHRTTGNFWWLESILLNTWPMVTSGKLSQHVTTSWNWKQPGQICCNLFLGFQTSTVLLLKRLLPTPQPVTQKLHPNQKSRCKFWVARWNRQNENGFWSQHAHGVAFWGENDSP